MHPQMSPKLYTLPTVTETTARLPGVAADPHAVNLTEARCFRAPSRTQRKDLEHHSVLPFTRNDRVDV